MVVFFARQSKHILTVGSCDIVGSCDSSFWPKTDTVSDSTSKPMKYVIL